MTGIRRLYAASLRRYIVYLFVAGPALNTHSLQADQPAPPLGDFMNSSPHAMDGSCEPAFRGGSCEDCCMDLWRGYCQEKPHGFPISPRRYADVGNRGCSCQRCPSVRPAAPCAQTQAEHVAPAPQPVAPSVVPAQSPAPADSVPVPPRNTSSAPAPNQTMETSSPQWEPTPPANEPTLAEPPLPKNVLPPQEVLEDEVPANDTVPQASTSRTVSPVAPEPRPLSVRPASVELSRGTSRLVRQLKSIR